MPIKKKFFLSFVLTALISCVIAKVLFWSASLTATDVNFINAESAVTKAIPYILKYVYMFFNLVFPAVAVAGIAYARAYFGPSTSYKIFGLAMAAYVLGEAGGFGFNAIHNHLSSGAIIATLLSSAVEILFMLVMLILTPSITSAWAKKVAVGTVRKEKSRILAAVVFPLVISLIVRLCDLTAFNVVPFLLEYTDVTSSEIFSIILDYVYYIFYHFAFPAVLAVIAFIIFRRITGPLKLKAKGAISQL